MVRISRREGLQLMLGASQAVLIGPAFAAVTYDGLVNTFRVDDGVSYWKFENDDGTDTWGTEDATYNTVPGDGPVATIVDLDTTAEGAPADGTCTAWTGASGSYADVAHNAAHKTAAGTIVVTFQLDSLSEKSTLVAADANAAAGGLSIEVQTNGAPRCFLRRQSDGAPVILTGQAGDVQLNEAYTLVLKWGPGGLSMALWNDSGNLLRTAGDPLTDGVTGTSPIRFGAWHTDVSHHDGPYGRVIWLKRRISDGDEADLARARTISRATPGEYITTPEIQPSWNAGNPASVTAALNEAIALASANAASSSTGRGVVELAPSTTYVAGCTNGSINNSNGCAILNAATPNVEIRTAGKPTGATRAILRFTSWAAQTGMHNRALVLFDGATNCWLTHVRLDGNKWSLGVNQAAAEANLATIPYTTAGNNGGLNNVGIQGSTNCRVEWVESYDAITDGIWIDEILSGGERTSGLLVQDCDVRHNRRQGMSIIECGITDGGFDQVQFRRCTFRDTGDESSGGYLLRGNKPAANVDIEPNQIADLIHGVSFYDCDFLRSYGATYNNGNVEGLSSARGFVFDGKAGTPQSRHFKMVNCVFSDNVGAGWYATLRGGDVRDWLLENLVMSGNGSNEMRIEDHTNTGTSQLISVTITNCNVPTINFRSTLANSGHSVTVWKGSFNPTVNTNGQTTITVNPGLPS